MSGLTRISQNVILILLDPLIVIIDIFVFCLIFVDPGPSEHGFPQKVHFGAT